MNANLLIFLLKILSWLTLIFFATFFELADYVLAGLKAREIFESKQGDRTTVNLWLKRGTDIRLALSIWKFIFFAAGIYLAFSFSFDKYLSFALAIKVSIFVFISLISAITVGLFSRLLSSEISDKSIMRLIKISNFWTIGTYYFNAILAKATEIFAKLFGVKDALQIFENQNENSALAEMAEKDESLEEDEHEMIKSIFEFGDTIVREVMVPRTEIEAADAEVSLSDAIEKSLAAGHSRLPIYEGNVDKIIGIFYLRDALKFWKARNDSELPSLREIIRKPFFVPETKKVNELLKEFRAAKIQLAVIIDEYGGTAGLATLEDLVEEIVGEIHDEFDDDEEKTYEQLDENTFVIDASVLVDDVNDDLEINLPEDEDFDTIGGYVMYKLGHVPKEGEIISEKEFEIKILKVTDRRVEKVELKRLKPREE